MVELSPTEKAAYEAVEEIQYMKQDNGQSPDYALLTEVQNFLRPELPAGFETDVLHALRSLYRRGLINYHSTINGVPMFGIINNNK